jgi:hypothetical protein
LARFLRRTARFGFGEAKNLVVILSSQSSGVVFRTRIQNYTRRFGQRWAPYRMPLVQNERSELLAPTRRHWFKPFASPKVKGIHLADFGLPHSRSRDGAAAHRASHPNPRASTDCRTGHGPCRCRQRHVNAPRRCSCASSIAEEERRHRGFDG